MRKLVFIVFFLNYISWGQEEQSILSYDQYISIVKEHHPLVKNAELRALSGQYQLKYAKGGFDAKIFSDIDQKYFDEKRYFSLMNSA